MPARSRIEQKLEFVMSGVFMAARAFSVLATGAARVLVLVAVAGW